MQEFDWQATGNQGSKSLIVQIPQFWEPDRCEDSRQLSRISAILGHDLRLAAIAPPSFIWRRLFVKHRLSKPTYENLTNAAMRAGKDRDEFRRIVTTSLGRIADIKNSRRLNIEVRFYPEDPKFRPIFRLMFIDNSICLASYNIFGECEGSQLPQLHVVRPPENSRVVHSFYYPLHRYFDWLWELSEPWDFTSFI